MNSAGEGELLLEQPLTSRHRGRLSGAREKWLGIPILRCYLFYSVQRENPNANYSWAAALHQTMGASWFSARGVENHTTCLGGRTRARNFKPAVCTRWRDGIQYAKTELR
jgi:hypothetical protein